MKNKSILVVSQYFYPEQFRINDICSELVSRGHEITVLTGIPNYPSGKYFKGYGVFQKRKETWNGINIIRLPIIPRGSSSIMMAFNYLSFVICGGIWSHFTSLKVDSVFIYEVSPFTQAIPGVWMADRLKIPCFINVMDLWPENVEIVGGVTNPFILGNIGKMVDYVYHHCDCILTSSKSFISVIKARGMDPKKLKFWPQYAEAFYRPMSLDECYVDAIPQDDVLNITFAGNIGLAQGLDILPDCAALLMENGVKVRFNIIGDGRYKEELVFLVEKRELQGYFNFIDRQPADLIPQYFALSDVALITLAPNKIFEMTIPAKLQSAMACGMPIFAAAEGEIQDIIHEAQCGFFCAAGNSEALFNIIFKTSQNRDALKRMGLNARNYFEHHYDKKILMDWIEQEMESWRDAYVQK